MIRTFLLFALLSFLSTRALTTSTSGTLSFIARQERDNNDGLIGICPAGVFLPISTCFCYLLFSRQVLTKSQKDDRMGCLSFLGVGKKRILAMKDYCIPYTTKEGVVEVETVVSTINLFLDRCMEDVEIMPRPMMS